MRTTSLRIWLLHAASFLFLTGCVHYRLGPPQKLPFQSIHIKAVQNDSFAPQAHTVVSENLIEAFLRDGSVLVESSGRADATLEVTLFGYHRERSTTHPHDTALGRSFRLRLQARVSLLNNRSGETYFSDREFAVTEEAFIDDGLQGAEYQTIPVLALELARQIKNYVLSVW